MYFDIKKLTWCSSLVSEVNIDRQWGVNRGFSQIKVQLACIYDVWILRQFLVPPGCLVVWYVNVHVRHLQSTCTSIYMTCLCACMQMYMYAKVHIRRCTSCCVHVHSHVHELHVHIHGVHVHGIHVHWLTFMWHTCRPMYVHAMSYK